MIKHILSQRISVRLPTVFRQHLKDVPCQETTLRQPSLHLGATPRPPPPQSFRSGIRSPIATLSCTEQSHDAHAGTPRGRDQRNDFRGSISGVQSFRPWSGERPHQQSTPGGVRARGCPGGALPRHGWQAHVRRGGSGQGVGPVASTLLCQSVAET